MHPDSGFLRYPGCPIRLSETPATYRRPAPGLGEHNGEILAEVLGMDAAVIEGLERSGVLADRPPSVSGLT
jgi:crotonobetainyl-CoA:carnitine CoA-transferase CaiB-like acyl-CoA transferase